MHLSEQIAKQFREVFLNGNWVSTNLKTQLSNVDWENATTKIDNLNTIAQLTFHIDYYIGGLIQVFEGGKLNIKDKYSYDLPPIESEKDWKKLITQVLSNAEKFAELVEQMTDKQLEEDFVDKKYGSYYRNILAMIEHCYYHLGQIVLIKKLLKIEIN